ncbi:hypothetical protein AVEN_57219-1 [Araneus ventricosus]|uniref:Uncharacterized protein n=1 Tax=Araneus ventricosus TaxID=182803 RepID=A0A4Y2JBP1_ARAVE|nr:hypothetical protein AVEN_57219-1 [Araneus ventricosus]
MEASMCEKVYIYIYKGNRVREHFTGPQHYRDNGLASGTRGEVSRNQEEEVYSSCLLLYVNLHINPLTPKPAVIGHAISILVGRISAGYCSESGEKAVGEWSLRDPLG